MSKNKEESIYLAIPYSWNPDVAFKIANEVAAKLMHEGYVVFSPVSHSHPIASFLSSDDRYSHKFWMKQDLTMLPFYKTVMFVIIGSEGMKLIDDSLGCQSEMREAIKLNKPIKYYYYDYRHYR